ncbi:unnamed protein product [Euphydryas editha]|uniref:Uncharacterized protein n=1 Tax=Euphydryas editha TaxID=104508 RepID=A0AAU9U7R9_EUPED|nr:unnamed protein product [Euphydryas editha]
MMIKQTTEHRQNLTVYFSRLSSVRVITAPGGSTSSGEGREALRLRGVLVPGAQPLRHAYLRVLCPPALASGLQQPPGLLLPPARRLPAAVLGVPPAPGPGLVEVPTALPRDNVQRGNVLRLDNFFIF